MPHEIPTWQGEEGVPPSLARLRGSRYPIFDTHCHVVDFVQDTPGAACLLHYMDRANVPKAVVFGLPVTKLFGAAERAVPRYYLDTDGPCYYYSHTDAIVAELVRSAPPDQQHRFVPLICGFNPTDKHAIRHVERMLAQYPNLWQGIGEVLLRHDDLTALTYGEAARANHPALFPIYELAAERDLPVVLHQNVTSVTKGDHPIYVWELDEVLGRFPRTRFVFAHCGMSRRVEVPLYHQLVERLLGQYENLSVDFSWIFFDVLVCPHGRPNPVWLELTERFKDRICLGSDMVTKFERIGPELHRYDAFLRELSEDARKALCMGNAERIFQGRRGPPSAPLPEWERVVEKARREPLDVV